MSNYGSDTSPVSMEPEIEESTDALQPVEDGAQGANDEFGDGMLRQRYW